MEEKRRNTWMKEFSVRFDQEGLEKLGLLAEYLHKLGVIKSNSRAEVVRLALNRLWADTVKAIQEKRYGGA